MALTTKKPKFADDEIVICAMSFSSGADIAVRGERYRGDYPLVRDFASHFVPADTPRTEWPNMFDSLEPVEHESEFTRQVTPIPDSEAAVAECSFSAAGQFVAKGLRLRRDDPRVVAHPHLFRTVGVLVSELSE